MLKTVVFAPIPSASVTITTAANPGAFFICRSAYFTSRPTPSTPSAASAPAVRSRTATGFPNRSRAALRASASLVQLRTASSTASSMCAFSSSAISASTRSRLPRFRIRCHQLIAYLTPPAVIPSDQPPPLVAPGSPPPPLPSAKAPPPPSPAALDSTAARQTAGSPGRVLCQSPPESPPRAPALPAQMLPAAPSPPRCSDLHPAPCARRSRPSAAPLRTPSRRTNPPRSAAAQYRQTSTSAWRSCFAPQTRRESPPHTIPCRTRSALERPRPAPSSPAPPDPADSPGPRSQRYISNATTPPGSPCSRPQTTCSAPPAASTSAAAGRSQTPHSQPRRRSRTSPRCAPEPARNAVRSGSAHQRTSSRTPHLPPPPVASRPYPPR